MVLFARLALLSLALLVAVEAAPSQPPNPIPVDSVQGHLLTKDYQQILTMRSRFTKIKILSRPYYGRALAMANKVVASQRDEYLLSEMLTLPALIGSGRCEDENSKLSILVIGGPDGGAQRVLQEQPCVSRIVDLQPDRILRDMARDFLGLQGNSSDPRLQQVVDDPLEFLLKRATEGDRFDLVVLASNKEFLKGLYSGEGFKRIAVVLKSGGLVAGHLGNPFILDAPEPVSDLVGHIRTSFAHVDFLHVCVPTNVDGGEIGLFVASSGALKPPARTPPTPAVPWKYFTTEFLSHVAALPPYLAALLDGEVLITRPLQHKKKKPKSALFKTSYQLAPLDINRTRIEILDDWNLGNILLLAGAVSRSALDGAFFEEMVANVALGSNPLCGIKNLVVVVHEPMDGSLVQHILRYPNVKQVIVIEYNKLAILAIAPMMSKAGRSLMDPRVSIASTVEAAQQLITAQGLTVSAVFLPRRSETSTRTATYAQLSGLLNDKQGVFVATVGLPFFMSTVNESLPLALADLQTRFKHVKVFRTFVPSQVGGEMAVAISSNSDQFTPETPTCPVSDISFCSYTPATHKAAFALPAYWHDLINGLAPRTARWPTHARPPHFGDWAPPVNKGASESEEESEDEPAPEDNDPERDSDADSGAKASDKNDDNNDNDDNDANNNDKQEDTIV